MKQLTRLFFLILMIAANSYEIFAQRTEDHFVRRRVVHRMELGEKLNVPIVRPEYSYPNEDNAYVYTKGTVASIIGGLKAGRYTAYNPDNLAQALGFKEVETRIQEMNSVYDEQESEFGEIEDAEIDNWDDSEWEFEGEFLEEDDLGTVTADNQSTQDGEVDLADFEGVIQFVEDWIFDKVRSDIVYDIKFVEIIWVDPAGALPDKVLAVFKWDEISETMDQTQWINRFNEAENRSVKEIFDLRIFNSYLIDVSGIGMNSLQEAEIWRRKLVEFEHHLYSY